MGDVYELREAYKSATRAYQDAGKRARGTVEGSPERQAYARAKEARRKAGEALKAGR